MIFVVSAVVSILSKVSRTRVSGAAEFCGIPSNEPNEILVRDAKAKMLLFFFKQKREDPQQVLVTYK